MKKAQNKLAHILRNCENHQGKYFYTGICFLTLFDDSQVLQIGG